MTTKRRAPSREADHSGSASLDRSAGSPPQKRSRTSSALEVEEAQESPSEIHRNDHPRSNFFHELPVEIVIEILDNLPLDCILALRLVSRKDADRNRDYIEERFRRGLYAVEALVYQSTLDPDQRRERRTHRRRRRAGSHSRRSSQRSQQPHHHERDRLRDRNVRQDRRGGSPAVYYCPGFALKNGAILTFIPKDSESPTSVVSFGSSSSSSSASQNSQALPASTRVPSDPVLERTPVPHHQTHHQPHRTSIQPPVNPAPSTVPQNELERHLSHIRIRFRDPAVRGSSAARSPLSVSLPFHPRPQPGVHTWDKHHTSAIQITYAVEEEPEAEEGSYCLLVRSLTIKWSWLSRKIQGTNRRARAIREGEVGVKGPVVRYSPAGAEAGTFERFASVSEPGRMSPADSVTSANSSERSSQSSDSVSSTDFAIYTTQSDSEEWSEG